MTLLSALTAAIAELAADAAVAAIVPLDASGVRRIRPIEPAGKTATDPGDARESGAYVPFVVVSILDNPPVARMPIRNVVLGIRAYHATYAGAEALWLACEAVFRDKAARVAASGLGVWFSTIQAGGIPDRDPDTQQPLFSGAVYYPTTLASVA
jgi:hypothetical protein